MKKTIALFLALILALGAGLAPAESDITGDWYAEMDGLALRLTLNGDGGYAFSVPGSEPMNGAWELLDGFVYMDGDEDAPLSWDGQTLTNIDAGLFFTREPASAYAPADLQPDASLLQYEGAWCTAYVVQDGAVLPAAYSEDNILIYIEEGKAILKGGPFGYRLADLAFENGALTYAAEDMTARMLLQQDGLLRLTTEKDGQTETFILICTAFPELDADE